MTDIRIDPKRVARAFLWAVVFLSFMNASLLILNYYTVDSRFEGLLSFFDLDVEGNIPTLYSALAVLVCSGLLALITRIHWHRPDGKRWHWLGLTLLFFFLGLDEGTAIHEELGDFLEEYVAAEGALYFPWVIAYGIATAVIALLYLRFVLQLPRATRVRFIVAGLLFLGGALGFEMLSAIAADRSGYDSISYTVLYSIEEMLEMLGIVLFIYALLSYLAEEAGGLVLRLSRGESPPPARPH